jgi:hypothetical protein
VLHPQHTTRAPSAKPTATIEVVRFLGTGTIRAKRHRNTSNTPESRACLDAGLTSCSVSGAGRGIRAQADRVDVNFALRKPVAERKACTAQLASHFERIPSDRYVNARPPARRPRELPTLTTIKRRGPVTCPGSLKHLLVHISRRLRRRCHICPIVLMCFLARNRRKVLSEHSILRALAIIRISPIDRYSLASFL